jgi:hypothetical protein
MLHPATYRPIFLWRTEVMQLPREIGSQCAAAFLADQQPPGIFCCARHVPSVQIRYGLLR